MKKLAAWILVLMATTLWVDIARAGGLKPPKGYQVDPVTLCYSKTVGDCAAKCTEQFGGLMQTATMSIYHKDGCVAKCQKERCLD